MRSFLTMGLVCLASIGTAVAGPGGSMIIEPSSLSTPVGYDHNGSFMKVSFEDGFIVYETPKDSIAGTVVPGQVLFRGTMKVNGRISGTAFVFKRGCAPAPYAVEGRDTDAGFVLTGKAPIRGPDCAVIGYSSDGPNTRLKFRNLMSL